MCGKQWQTSGMTKAEWAEVDSYLVETLVGDGDSETLRANAAAGLPAIDVSPPQGKFLYLIAKSVRARRVLEIGTLGGYSTTWLARAVGKSGQVVTLEYEPKHAETARGNLDRAGVGERVEIRVGAALDSLPVLAEEGAEAFDLVFIDADKVNNANYVQWALRLTRPGSVIIVDNVVRNGGISDADSADAAVRASREVIELIAAEPRLDGTVLQTVGGKGWDGFAYAVVLDEDD
ncbi:O-methyltransferase [Nocardia sp. JMUB6875]